jgi:hypothetical protein
MESAQDFGQPLSKENASPSQSVRGVINANVYQIAVLNNMLSRGFKFEAFENVRKTEVSAHFGAKKRVLIYFFISRRTQIAIIKCLRKTVNAAQDQETKKLIKKLIAKRI